MLLYFNQVDIKLLQSIKTILLANGFDVQLNSQSICSTLLEWQDFFQLNEEGNITLTIGALHNRKLVATIFVSPLSSEVKDIIIDTITKLESNKIKIISYNSKLE